MENKGLLKLPETWHVIVNDSNRNILEKWLYSFYPTMKEYDNRLCSETVNFIKGDEKPMQGCIPSGSQEITFADFKRLVLGEKPKSMESKQNEITIVKTWETIYFTTEKVSVELTLNHEKNTFDLQTATEEMVSFKKDTFDIARARLKCIKSALDYAEKHLNK